MGSGARPEGKKRRGPKKAAAAGPASRRLEKSRKVNSRSIVSYAGYILSFINFMAVSIICE
jgi:hypothetical protein